MSDDEPDWSLLPGDPRAFFGIEGELDRKVLKRAYNKWLRRFRPEHFPEEFQRLRAAYEQLEEELRFGEARTPVNFGGGDRGGVLEPRGGEESAPAFDAAGRLGSATPEEVLAELRDRKPASGREHVHLALLEEALEGQDDPLALHDRLIRGVLATQGAPEVVHFLVALCREELPTAAAGKLVQRLVRLVHGPGRGEGFEPDWYYFVSSPQWLSLAERARPGDLLALLQRCREELSDAGGTGYLVLLARLVRRLSYRADEGWIEETIRVLEENYRYLPPIEQEELDVLRWLDGYRTRRGEFRDGSPAREAVDGALIAVTQGDETLADRTTLAALTGFLDRPQELLEAFPGPGDEDLDYAVEPFLWYADEVAERYGTPYVERVNRQRLREFLYQLERRTGRSMRGRLWSFLSYLLFFGPVALALTPAVLLNRGEPESEPGDLLSSLVILVPIALLALAYFRGWLARLRDRATAGVRGRLYEGLWRPAVVDFLRDHHVSREAFLDALREIDEDDVTVDGHVFLFALEDAGLALYASALRFQ